MTSSTIAKSSGASHAFASQSEPSFHRLAGGLEVVLCPQPHLHSVGVGLYIKAGPRYEDPRRMGISHFLEHVLFRGNARYNSSLEMNRAFEAWGGSINGYTTREYTYYFGKLHPDYLHEAVPFMGDFIREPGFTGVEMERQIILEERLEDVDEDGQELDVDDVSRMGFWGDHPLGYKIIGSPGSIRGINERHLREHFGRFYRGGDLVFCVTGCFDEAAILPVIEASFAFLAETESVDVARLSPKAPTHPNRSTAFVYQDSNQVSIQMTFLGFSPKDPDFWTLLLLDLVLDDGMSSRLWQRIVEELGLCYELWASLEIYHDTSLLDIGANVAPEKVIPLVEEITKQLQQLRDEGPSEEEFALAQRRWRFSQEYMLDQVETLNERLGASALFDLYVPLEEQIEKITTVTKDDFQQMCRRVLSRERLMFAGVGPLSKSLKRRLRDFAKHF